MIAAKLIELIERQAGGLTRDVTKDLMTNERTRGFRGVRQEDLEQRIFQLVNHLGNWIGAPKSERVEVEFTDWGRRRFDQNIPLSEIIYAIIVLNTSRTTGWLTLRFRASTATTCCRCTSRACRSSTHRWANSLTRRSTSSPAATKRKRDTRDNAPGGG